MSSKGRKIAKHIGKSLRKKFDLDPLSESDDLQQRLNDLCSPEGHAHPHSSYVEMKSSSMQPTIQGMGKSTSLSTVNEAGDSAESNYREIAALAHDMKNFADNLTKLKILFIEGLQLGDEARVVSQESLEEVLSVLKSTLQRYSALQSPEIFAAARALISKIKSHNYEEELDEEELQTLLEAIEGLAITFSTSVSKYLMVDFGREKSGATEAKTKSCEDLVKAREEEGSTSKPEHHKAMTGEEQDSIMARLDAGLDVALARAKVWSRYTRGIITYIEKKSQLELEYARSLARITNSMQNSFVSEDLLPLQSILCGALKQDGEFAANLQATQAMLHTSKFVELLLARRNEHDRVRKSVKESWDRELRKMNETVSNLRKAQAMYVSRQQEFERAREAVMRSDSEKLDKRKKLEEETMHKAAEAETTYKACVAEANLRQRALEKTKSELLATLREQIHLCDKDIRTVAVEYFDLLHTVWSPLPLQYQILSDSSKEYEPGSQYAEFIMRLPAGASRPKTEEFVFEPYVPGQKLGEGRKTSVQSNGSSGEHMQSNEDSPASSPRRDKYRSPVRAWSQTSSHVIQQTAGSDTDSASGSSKSRDSSPSSSPHDLLRRKIVSSQSLDELTEEDGEKLSVQELQEKRGQMRRTLTVAGEEALELSGLLMHNQGRRNTTFGVDFQEQVDRYKSQVPPIITKCLGEIEQRGVTIKGIYRVSGVKSKVESLCQRFDINPELVDLEEVHPNIISNVLKLYLRQLPEPLLTFRLYSDFIHLAKESMSGYLQGDKLVDRLGAIVHRLPVSNFKTCAVLMHHLHRVAAYSHENQMSSSNLGIVFGPTLLRPLEGTASLASLVDTPHQTRAVELLITNAEAVFGPGDNFQLLPDQTPVEALEDSANNLTINVPSGLIEPSPERSPTREISEAAASVSCSPTLPLVSASPSPTVPSMHSLVAASTPPTSVAPEDRVLLVSEDEPTSMLEPSAADFSLPGSTTVSQDGDDGVFVDSANGAAPLGQGLGAEMDDSSLSGLDSDDDDLPDSLLPDQSCHSPSHAPFLTPHCMAGNNTALAKLVPGDSLAPVSLPSSAPSQPILSSATVPVTLSKPVSLTQLVNGPPAKPSPGQATNPTTVPLMPAVNTAQSVPPFEQTPLPATQPPSAPSAISETDAALSSSQALAETGAVLPSPLAVAMVDSSTWPGPASRAAVGCPLTVALWNHPSTASTSSLSSISDGSVSPVRQDSRADRFKLEQRKLLSAIKSDPKLGIVLSAEGGSANKNVPTTSTDGDAKSSSPGQNCDTGKTACEDENKGQSVGDEERRPLVKSSSLEIDGDSLTVGPKDECDSVIRKDTQETDICKEVGKSDSSQPSRKTESSQRGGTKMGTSIISRSEMSPVRLSSTVLSKPATVSSSKVRTTATSASQRRANILGLSGAGAAGTVAGTSSSSSSGRPVLTRYTASSSAGLSASSPRRLSSLQASGSTSLCRTSSGPSSTSGQRQGGAASTSINSGPLRYSFESSLRSYTTSPHASTSAGMETTTLSGTVPLQKGGSAGSRSGVSGGKTSGTAGASRSAAPTRTTVCGTGGKTADAAASSASRSTSALVSTTTSSIGTSRKSHERCFESKTGESGNQASVAGALPKGLSQDRTPRFV